MAAIDRSRVSLIINANAPVGTSGAPGAQLTALSASPMKVKLVSTSSTAAASGTELSGTGYTTGGQALSAASTSSSSGSSVTLPASSALNWTNSSGAPWTVQGFEVTASDGARVWVGDFNGAPITIASGNTFQIPVAGITLGLS